ncbi:unnamed protein product [Linum tenue]|uniref:Uncharacterized protein n=1 Tax=Linum tenue TaxID=586396 RepID=A0AAV0LPH3_9ROSI|nr:unnamed protein product [Linum tenue]
MAAALVSQVQKELVDFAIKEVKKRGKFVIDAEKDIEKLISTFTAIGALLLDAEERQLKNEGIENWLKKLKDVSYEIDDVLDEWRTEILKRRLDDGDDAAGGGCLEVKLLQISDFLKRVCPFLPTYCFSPKEIGLRYDIGSRMKTLNERLDDIDKEKNLYILNPKETASYSSLQTSPNINFSDVKGREEELKILHGKLLGDDHSGVRSLLIQGPGGFGKTTLAKMLYNDKKVEAHFDKRIWVCVSDKFDLARVAKAILESFDEDPKSSSSSYKLERINAHTNDKKFLLVLDDVWEDSQSKWEELITSVSHGLPGSKILGFLKATMNQDMEEVGEEYFQMLVMRSFFQDLEIHLKWDVANSYCKIHDFVHDFARLTSKNECISILEQDTNSSLLSMSNEVRHLMVEHVSEVTNKLIVSIGCSRLSSTNDNDYLRSFIARSGGAIEPVYAHLRGLRSLVLFGCDVKVIPSTITQLIHLRLLDLSFNKNLVELPKEICELYNLESLLLNYNRLLAFLPSGMGNKLINLKHLENYLVPAALPRSMVKLANSLKTLTQFKVVREEQKEGATNIGDLECMNHIQGSLTIRGLSKVTNCEEVKRAEVAKKESLTHLSLEFKSSGEEVGHEEEQVLEAIRPSSTSLENLIVMNYSGRSICPSWLLSLSNLTSLEFNECPEVEHLPPLGALPSLEELRLRDMHKVKKIGLEFLFGSSLIEQQLGMMSNNKGREIIAFPKLTLLKISSIGNWEVWDLERDDQEAGMMINSATVMPRLRYLELTCCSKLDKVPDLLLRKTTLKYLEISATGWSESHRFKPWEVPKMVPREVWDKISHIPTIFLDFKDVRTTFKNEIGT